MSKKGSFNQPIIKTYIKDRCLFYDPVFIDFNSWQYKEEVFLRENNNRALEYFKEKFKDKIKKASDG